MFKLFEQKCQGCSKFHFGPREGAKAKGRWLGYEKCPTCRKKECGPDRERK